MKPLSVKPLSVKFSFMHKTVLWLVVPRSPSQLLLSKCYQNDIKVPEIANALHQTTMRSLKYYVWIKACTKNTITFV